MTYREIRQMIGRLQKKISDFDAKGSLTENEEGIYGELVGEKAILERKLKEFPEAALTIQFGGHQSNGPFPTLGEQLLSIRKAGTPSGRVDPRLYEIRAAASGLSESIPSEGGFLLQQDFNDSLLQSVFDTSVLAPMCQHQPIGGNANSIKLPGLDETSRVSGSRFGGVLGYWIPEAGEITKSKPKFRAIELNLKKVCVLIYPTNELLSDAVALEAFIRKVTPAELAFQVDDAICNGTGAGQPLGILNAGCLVTVAKESGQHKETILAENVMKMVKRTLGKSTNYVWLYSKSCLDQIYSLSLAVGMGGIPLFIAGGTLPNFPENRLLGLRLIECEQCGTVGSLGDLILANFGNGYILGEKGGVKADMSIHVRFEFDESVFKFVLRIDGQPVRASALTPYKGGVSNSESHFVALAERA